MGGSACGGVVCCPYVKKTSPGRHVVITGMWWIDVPIS
jgi:hypothetical protein